MTHSTDRLHDVAALLADAFNGAYLGGTRGKATLDNEDFATSVIVEVPGKLGVTPEKFTFHGHFEPHEFKPDWCIAPAVTLRSWMRENHLSVPVLASIFGGRLPATKDVAQSLIEEVLDRGELSVEAAHVLQVCTQIPARFWLAREHYYRAGLSAGLTDTTPTER
jgi:hypothetical protein